MDAVALIFLTGVLIAVVDGLNHVSVMPRNVAELSIWMKTRPTESDLTPNGYLYYLTVVLSNISVKHNGKTCPLTSE